jgi:hypothetical protein
VDRFAGLAGRGFMCPGRALRIAGHADQEHHGCFRSPGSGVDRMPRMAGRLIDLYDHAPSGGGG